MTGRVLVIGASGYLGSQVAERARSAGLDVITAGRSQPASEGTHLRLDLAATDPGRLARALSILAPDAVINCAGATGGDPDRLAAINVTGTEVLCQAMLTACPPGAGVAGGSVGPPGRPGVSASASGPAPSAGLPAPAAGPPGAPGAPGLPARAGPPPWRLVHLGSAAEYGPGEPGVPVTESAPARPPSAYGITKLAGTRLVELARSAGLDAVVLRVFNPVGPGAPGSLLPGRVAGQLRRALDDGGGVTLGALDAVRDFVDTRDVADAVLAAALAPRLTSPILNVAAGRGTQVRDLVRELVAASGYQGEIHEDEAPGGAGAKNAGPGSTDLAGRSVARSWQQADITSACRELAWAPRRDLAASATSLWQSLDEQSLDEQRLDEQRLNEQRLNEQGVREHSMREDSRVTVS